MDVSPPAPALSAAARRVCAGWFGSAPVEVGASPGGGFSGATLARVRPRGTAAWFVLKAFAPGVSADRAAWIHGLARHLGDSGVAEVPVPLALPGGGTIATVADGGLWEMVPFVPGLALDAPTPAQAAAAAAVLARVHVAAGAIPGSPPVVGRPAAVTRRIATARDLLARPWRARRDARATSGPFAPRLDRAIAIFEAAHGDRAVAVIAAAPEDGATVQAVLRDVWSAHVLFAPDPPRVAGIVDLHAAGIDSPAADVARLLGSWRREGRPDGDPLRAWPEAVAAYEAVRPLDRVERRLVPFLHAAGVVCGLDNWFRWTLDEGRTFTPAATLRVDRLLEDLPAALDALADGVALQV